MMADINSVKEELAKIQASDKQKLLKPESVVEYARKNKGSALHNKFVWDDGVAADLYRLKQARDLIRVVVTVVNSDSTETVVTVSEYVSLSDNRGSGYENIVDVIESPARSGVLLHDVLKRLLGIKEVALFDELSAVNKAIQKAAAVHMPEEKEAKEKPKSKYRSESLRV